MNANKKNVVKEVAWADECTEERNITKNGIQNVSSLRNPECLRTEGM